jgi:hypothetical protein
LPGGSRGLGDVYKRQDEPSAYPLVFFVIQTAFY